MSVGLFGDSLVISRHFADRPACSSRPSLSLSLRLCVPVQAASTLRRCSLASLVTRCHAELRRWSARVVAAVDASALASFNFREGREGKSEKVVRESRSERERGT